MSDPRKDADPDLGASRQGRGGGEPPTREEDDGADADALRRGEAPGLEPASFLGSAGGAAAALDPKTHTSSRRRLSGASDEVLVKECLSGNEEAWCELIDKYRSLIFSVPIRYGIPTDGANEVFQQVCMQLLAHLDRLREPRSLPAWLIRTAAHECSRWKRQLQRHAGVELDEVGSTAATNDIDVVQLEIQREELLRQAIASLPPRCRELIQMLIYERPPISYAAAAERLGVATGSIGFIRIRCLRRLRAFLEKHGFRYLS